jgi:GTPase SAR1 family protein
MTLTDDSHLADPTDTLQLTRRQRDRVAELIGRFLPIGERLDMTTRLDNLRLAADRVREDAFSVLVMGEFNRGKSTLINALLGRKVLPTFAIETTATICEVHYGDAPKARLFPIDLPDSAAIETDVDDLERYVAVDEEDPTKPSPYRKVEVYWPVPLCRNGVVLVDSPGLNKSQAHEERTVGYLRSADAIVFVADSQNAWSRSEVGFVRQIPPGIDPFFVFNKINLVDEDERDRLRRSVIRRLAEIQPTGVRRHYFVDAKRALAAAGRDTEVDRSGVGEFVRDLQRFLGTERAAVKIGGPARELAEAVREARKQIPVRRGRLAMPLQEAEERVEAQRRPLAELVDRRAAIVKRIDEASDDLVRDVRRAMRQFLSDTAAQVPDWARTVDVSVKLGVNPFTADRVTQDFMSKLGQKLQERIAEAYLEWRNGRLTVLMDRHADDLGRDLDHDLAAFEAGLEQVRSGLIPDHMRVATSHRDQDGTPMARAVAAAGGMLLAGPGGALVGARLGPTQMLKSAIPQIAVGAGILMFTPLGWVAAAAAMAALGVIKVVGGMKVVEEKLRTAVAGELAQQLTTGAADRAEQFGEEIATELDKFRDIIDDGLAVRIEELQNQLEAMLNDRNRDRAELNRRQTELDAMETHLDALDDGIADLLAGLGPAVPIPRQG